jgi:plasmid stability protein
MADVKVRKLDDWVVDSLRARAKHAGHSLEHELRQVLIDKALEAQHAAAQRFTALRREMQNKYGVFSDSTPLIREDRDARG